MISVTEVSGAVERCCDNEGQRHNASVTVQPWCSLKNRQRKFERNNDSGKQSCNQKDSEESHIDLNCKKVSEMAGSHIVTGDLVCCRQGSTMGQMG
jgi:hypothetical protein